MLALNSPVIQQGYFYAGANSAHGAFSGWRAIESGAVIGPDALARIIREIEELNAVGADQGDTPTKVARQTARVLLSEAQMLCPIYVVPSAIEASEGDLLIHWDSTIKNVVLICPASDAKPAQIYTEILDGKWAIHSEIVEASAQDLSDALAWLLRGQ